MEIHDRGQASLASSDAASLGALTVIMPLKHYHAEFLLKAVDSILLQTDPRWSLLIIVEPEDLSRHHELLSRQCDDPRVGIIANQGRGLAGAVNTGMRAAASQFVALLMADDLWSLRAVEVLHKHIVDHPDVDFFHSSRVYVNAADARISDVFVSCDDVSADGFRQGGSPVKHLLCWRRTKGIEVGGLDEALLPVGPDDYDFPWIMAERGARFKAIKECLYFYRVHDKCYRLMTHLPLEIHTRELDRIMKKHGVPRWRRLISLQRAKWSFLRQCLYRTEAQAKAAAAQAAASSRTSAAASSSVANAPRS